MVPWDLIIVLRYFVQDVLRELCYGFVGLGGIRSGRCNLHLLFFEKDAVAEHLGGQVFVEIAVDALRGLIAYIVWDVHGAVGLGQQIVLFLLVFLAVARHVGQGIDSAKFLGWRRILS